MLKKDPMRDLTRSNKILYYGRVRNFNKMTLGLGDENMRKSTNTTAYLGLRYIFTQTSLVTYNNDFCKILLTFCIILL